MTDLDALRYGDLPSNSAHEILRMYPVVGAVAKWETPEAFFKQTKSASLPQLWAACAAERQTGAHSVLELLSSHAQARFAIHTV